MPFHFSQRLQTIEVGDGFPDSEIDLVSVKSAFEKRLHQVTNALHRGSGKQLAKKIEPLGMMLLQLGNALRRSCERLPVGRKQQGLVAHMFSN